MNVRRYTRSPKAIVHGVDVDVANAHSDEGYLTLCWRRLQSPILLEAGKDPRPLELRMPSPLRVVYEDERPIGCEGCQGEIRTRLRQLALVQAGER